MAALAYTVGLINDHGGWTKFKAFRDTWDFFGRNNQVAADQVGAWPMESFYYNTLAEGNPVNITAKYFTNRKGGPLTMFSGSGWAIPRGATERRPGLQVHEVDDRRQHVEGSRQEPVRPAQTAGSRVHGSVHGEHEGRREGLRGHLPAGGNKDFDDAVSLLVRAPRYAFAVPLSPASTEFKQAWMDAINRVLSGDQTPRQALDQAQREAQAAIDKAT